ncbi:MAG TPA: hypothetical protein VIA11_22435 [Acidimicrobiia bacterium]|nr:hypothetical protein [Acidimicrobiia bacterium]
MGKKSKGRKQSRKQQLAEQLVVEQQRTADVLETLSTSVSAQQSSSGDRLLEEIRKLLDDVLVAQHRTNQLLELALRAGFDDDEQARNP